jgi:hypothetical protein
MLLGAVVGLGYSVCALWSSSLVIAGAFSPATFFGGLGLLIAGLTIFGLREEGPIARWRYLRAEAVERPWELAIGIVAVVAACATLWDISGLMNFGASNPWRYWSDGLEIAAAGRVPEAVLQWGAAQPPAVSKLAFSSFNGAMSYLAEDPLSGMTALMKLNVAGLALAWWAAARELGLRVVAPALVLISVATSAPLRHSLGFDDDRMFTAEGFAAMASLVGLAVAVRGLGEEAPFRSLAAAMLCFGAAGLTHLIPTLVILGFFVCHSLTRLIVERRAVLIVRIAAVVAATGAILVGGLTLSRGDVGFESVRESDRIEADEGVGDPTRYFASGSLDDRSPEELQDAIEARGGWYEIPGETYGTFIERGFGLAPTFWARWGLPIGSAILALGIFLFSPRRLRPLGVACWVVGAGILVVALVFSFVYDTYLPARFPPRRMFAYGSLLGVLMTAAISETFIAAIARRRAWIAPAMAALVAVAVGAFVLPEAAPRRDRIERGRAGLEAANWIRGNLPCDVRLLVSQRTAGTFQAATGRASVVEGMAPFLRPELLDRVVSLLLDARRFFEDPAGNRAILEREAIDYVVVAKRSIFDAAPPLLGRAHPGRFARVDFLQSVLEGPSMDVYRVEGSPGRTDLPHPGAFPGYECGRRPLE